MYLIIGTARRLARTHTAHDNVQGDSRGTPNNAHPQIFIRYNDVVRISTYGTFKCIMLYIACINTIIL